MPRPVDLPTGVVGTVTISYLAKKLNVAWRTAYDLLVHETDINGRVVRWTSLASKCKARQNQRNQRIFLDKDAVDTLIYKMTDPDYDITEATEAVN